MLQGEMTKVEKSLGRMSHKECLKKLFTFHHKDRTFKERGRYLTKEDLKNGEESRVLSYFRKQN